MKAVPIGSLEPTLLRRIANDAGRHFGLASPPAPARAWLLHNPYSIVMCLQLTQGDWSCRVFAKLPRKDHVRLDRLRELMRKEHDLLHRLASPALAPGQAGTVEPLAFYDDVPSVVTIEADGSTLRHAYARQGRLWSSAPAREDLVHRAALAGSWLAQFHTRSEVARQPFDVEELLQYCRPRLVRLQQRHPGVLPAGGEQLLERAARRVAEPLADAATGVRVCGRHNDFASHNIIACTDGGIRVLDFMAYDQGSGTYDVCNFWFELEQLKFDPTHPAALLGRLQEAFLEAYGSVDVQQPEFELARLRYSINRLLNELEHRRSWRALWPRWHLCVRHTSTWLRAFAARAR